MADILSTFLANNTLILVADTITTLIADAMPIFVANARKGEGNKVDIDGRSIVIISTSSQSCASITLVTRPIVNIYIGIDEISYRADFPHFRRVRISGDVSETGREHCSKRLTEGLHITTKKGRGISVVNQLSFGVNHGKETGGRRTEGIKRSKTE